MIYSHRHPKRWIFTMKNAADIKQDLAPATHLSDLSDPSRFPALDIVTRRITGPSIRFPILKICSQKIPEYPSIYEIMTSDKI